MSSQPEFEITADMVEMLLHNIKDLLHIGEFEHYPMASVVPATKQLMERCGGMMVKNQCYDNTFQIVHNHTLTERDEREIRYCCGIAIGASSMPVAHAWIKIAGQYHDLSWEMLAREKGLEGVEAYVQDFKYYTMAELTGEQLGQALLVNGLKPPCPRAIVENCPQFLIVKREEKA